MSWRRAGGAGFTLIEMLVALAVLGFLFVGLTQGMRTGFAMRQAQVARIDRTAELDPAMRLLRRLLTRLPRTAAGSSVIPTAAGAGFRGEADRVSFVGELPNGLGGDRLAEIALFVRDRSLYLAWIAHRHEYKLREPPPATETVLLQGVERLRLAYWGSPGDAAPQAWQQSWDSLEAPDLIRLGIDFASGDGRRWPDLIAAPRS